MVGKTFVQVRRARGRRGDLSASRFLACRRRLGRAAGMGDGVGDLPGRPGKTDRRRPMRVVLSCGARKGPVPAPAIELYTGNYFRALARFARRFDSPIFILSAKHGLIRSTTV